MRQRDPGRISGGILIRNVLHDDGLRGGYCWLANCLDFGIIGIQSFLLELLWLRVRLVRINALSYRLGYPSRVPFGVFDLLLGLCVRRSPYVNEMVEGRGCVKRRRRLAIKEYRVSMGDERRCIGSMGTDWVTLFAFTTRSARSSVSCANCST